MLLRKLSRLCTFLWIVSAAGCAQPPNQELDMAAARIEVARASDAALFAAEPLASAEAALAEARRLAEEEKAYRSAILVAGEAVEHADEATRQSTIKKRIVARKLTRCLGELEGLISIAGSHGATPEELAPFELRYQRVRTLGESGDLLAAIAEAEAFKPELLLFEQRFRGHRSPGLASVPSGVLQSMR